MNLNFTSHKNLNKQVNIKQFFLRHQFTAPEDDEIATIIITCLTKLYWTHVFTLMNDKICKQLLNLVENMLKLCNI